MMRKILSLIVLLIMLPICTKAEMAMALQLELVNGKTISFVLVQKPVITFSGDSITITEGGFVTNYLRSEVSHYHFSLVDTSIGFVKEDEVQIVQVLPYLYKVLGFSGKVQVYNVAGMSFSDSVTDINHEVLINMQSLPTGVYIIKIGNLRTIKIAKK